jgi:hypothetical protein
MMVEFSRSNLRSTDCASVFETGVMDCWNLIAGAGWNLLELSGFVLSRFMKLCRIDGNYMEGQSLPCL